MFTGIVSYLATSGNLSESATSTAYFNIFRTDFLFRYECNWQTIYGEIGRRTGVYIGKKIFTLQWKNVDLVSYENAIIKGLFFMFLMY